VPAVGFEFGNAVGHHDRDSGDLEHFEIVVIVSDGENFLALESLSGGPLGERAALGAIGGKNVNHGEIARLVKRDGEAIARGEVGGAENGFDGAHFRDGAGEHDLNGIFGKGIFERGDDTDVLEIAFVVGVADGIVLTERFEKYLILARAIEDDGGAFAPGFGGGEDAAGNILVQQMAEMGFAVGGADEGAVVDDHGERAGKLVRDGHGEIVAAAGDEGDFDAAACGFGDGGAVGFGELPAAVKEGAVNVQSDEADRHSKYCIAKGLRIAPVPRG